MYFLVALACTIISAIVYVIFKNHKHMHLDVLVITYGASTLMWLIDCINGALEGEGFISFSSEEFSTDLAISIATVVGGIIFWGIMTLVLNKTQKREVIKE